MRNNSTKWTIEEEQMMKKLKEQQKQKNELNWEVIAEVINKKFKTKKTAKQCRERYVNYLKFGENNSLNFEWSQQELNLMTNIYLQNGPSWSLISKFFPNKSQNSLKNKFNSSLKGATKLLNEHKTKKYRNCRLIQKNILSILLRTVNQMIQSIKCMKLTINYDSLMLKFRQKLITLCFKPFSVSQEDKSQLIGLITTISTKLKPFKMFKAKDSRQIIISDKTINAICQFDNVIKHQGIKDTPHTTNNSQKQVQNSVKVQQSLSTFMPHHQINMASYEFYSYSYYWPYYNFENVKTQP